MATNVRFPPIADISGMAESPDVKFNGRFFIALSGASGAPITEVEQSGSGNTQERLQAVARE